jgi:hypothetical protein
VELHAFQGKRPVAHRHHESTVDGPAGHLDLRRQGVLQDRQRVVPGTGEGRRKAGQHARTGVRHQRRLAVQEFRRALHHAAVRLADRLVAQADPEDRELAGVRTDQVEHDAGPVGRAWAGREQYAVRARPSDLGHGDLVVAPYVALHPELPQVLHEVVDERVVVVDHKHAHGVSSGVGADLHVIEG